MLKALHHERIDSAEQQAQNLLQRISNEYNTPRNDEGNPLPRSGYWIFGDTIGPTVLDAHVVPFIARLVESGRHSLVPENLSEYARRIVKGKDGGQPLSQWLEVTHGRRTSWQLSYGHVHELKDL